MGNMKKCEKNAGNVSSKNLRVRGELCHPNFFLCLVGGEQTAGTTSSAAKTESIEVVPGNLQEVILGKFEFASTVLCLPVKCPQDVLLLATKVIDIVQTVDKSRGVSVVALHQLVRQPTHLCDKSNIL